MLSSNEEIQNEIEWQSQDEDSSPFVKLVGHSSTLVKPDRARSSERRLFSEQQTGSSLYDKYYYHDEDQRPRPRDEEKGQKRKRKVKHPKIKGRQIPPFSQEDPSKSLNSDKKYFLWNLFVTFTSFYIPNVFLEKVAGLIGFMSLGLTPWLCPTDEKLYDQKVYLKDLRSGSAEAPFNGNQVPWIMAKGWVYTIDDFNSVFLPKNKDSPNFENLQRSDVSHRFSVDMEQACSDVASNFKFSCSIDDSCLDVSFIPTLRSSPSARLVIYEYSDIIGITGSNLTYYNGFILDLTEYFALKNEFLGPQVHDILSKNKQRDMTLALKKYDSTGKVGSCLASIFTVGNLSKMTPGCFSNRLIMIAILVLVFSITIFRFFAAILFNWIYSARLNTLTKRYKISNRLDNKIQSPQKLTFPYTVILVTCYSEDDQSIRGTLESLAHTDYFDEYKMLFIVCDGLVRGKGNTKSTPELVLDMIEIEKGYEDPTPQTYEAIADGPKKVNKAKVYPGYFVFHKRKIAAIVVVKCGNDDENGKDENSKPGNRGKRDSQMILMNLLNVSFFDERMTALEFDLFTKIGIVMTCKENLKCFNVNRFEMVLMVDADTRVDTESLSRMVAAMQSDPMVMGLCGETKISNKTSSWVTRIQVFEYYISHYLGKAFESVFGGVTCLPGCFSMIRIKAPVLENDMTSSRQKIKYWTPILINPDILADYRQSSVTTLHQKNLLFLGEDRFLSTLLLRTFPRRKMIFVPQAICRTTVPETYKVLNSQRRRWINSTIHNLMELILVRKLCGIFCFSMQFVILIELVGTVVLPAALFFTFMMIIEISKGPIDASKILPLTILVFILFLPGVLVLLTTRKLVYLYWFLIYLLALPIWNFSLPLYAFWHMDDFSWGSTRMLGSPSKAGDNDGHSNETESDTNPDTWGNLIVRKKWSEWNRYLEIYQEEMNE